MATCLTTTLRDSASGGGLKAAEEARIHVIGRASVPSEQRSVEMMFSKNTVVEATGSGTFYDANSTNLGSSVQFTAYVAKTIYLSNPGSGSEYDVIIHDKYSLARLMFSVGLIDVVPFISLDIEDFAYASNLGAVSFTNAIISGDIKYCKGLNALIYLNLDHGYFSFDIGDLDIGGSIINFGAAFSGFYGDLSSVSGWTNATNINIIGCNISGDLSALSGLTSLQTFQGPQLQCASLAGDIGDLAACTSLRQFVLGIEPQVEGSVAVFANMPLLQTLTIANAKISGSIDSLSDLGNLSTVNFANCQRLEGSLSAFEESAATLLGLWLNGVPGIEGNLSSLASCAVLSNLYLGYTSVAGDVDALADVTALTNVSLADCYSVSGDVAAFAGMPGLLTLDLQGTQVTGDIGDLAALTGLTTLTISRTGIGGDISAGTANCENLTAVYADNCPALGGDLALLPENCSFIELIGSGACTWSTRPATSCIVGMNGANLGTYVDAMLVNQAQCVRPAGAAAPAFTIRCLGTRTSASDSAVQALNALGYGVYVNNVLVVV